MPGRRNLTSYNRWLWHWRFASADTTRPQSTPERKSFFRPERFLVAFAMSLIRDRLTRGFDFRVRPWQDDGHGAEHRRQYFFLLNPLIYAMNFCVDSKCKSYIYKSNILMRYDQPVERCSRFPAFSRLFETAEFHKFHTALGKFGTFEHDRRPHRHYQIKTTTDYQRKRRPANQPESVSQQCFYGRPNKAQIEATPDKNKPKAHTKSNRICKNK